MKTRIIVVRHGETEWNRDKIFQGQLDSPLSEMGLLQAKAVAAALADEPVQAIYSSDLGRAMATAEIIAKPHHLQVIPEPRLRERHLGIFQGMVKKDISDKYPEELQRYNSGDPDHIIPNGESSRQRFDRSTACFLDLAKKHAGERIILVTHGGVLRGILEMVLNLPQNRKRHFSLLNASIARFSCYRGYWMMDSWGETQHLKDLKQGDDYQA